MKKVFIAAFGATLISISAASFAEDNKPVGSGPNPFTDCGIGAALFPTVHWAAVSSNIIWDIGTTAVVSATASPETCNAKNVETAKFILETYDSLVEESARGEGEHLTSVLSMMQCGAGQKEAAIQMIRAGISETVQDNNYQSQGKIEKAGAMFQVIQSAVTNTCAA